jgi:hypothetical protein
VTLILVASILAAPVPRCRIHRPAPVDGVYIVRDAGFAAVLWFRKDGSYGARWNETNYEGKWTLNIAAKRMDIMERVLGSPEPLYPWTMSLDKIKKIHNIDD